MRSIALSALWLVLLLAAPAYADRVQVYSIQGADCELAEQEVAPHLKKVKGVRKWSFDAKKYEFTVTLGDQVKDESILKAIAGSGCFRGVVGAGLGSRPGAYTPDPFPESADYAVVTANGSKVGALEKLRVPGKYTVLDFYADWCAPCRVVDKQLRDIVAKRNDVAIRKLNVMNYESPLAKELGRKLRGLPYVIVYSPDGKKTEIVGENAKRLNAALGVRG